MTESGHYRSEPGAPFSGSGARPGARTNLKSEFQIGIWGTAGAGKTTYLAMLYESLAFDPMVTVIASEEAKAFAIRYRGDIMDKGEFPTPTIGQEQYSIFQYTVYPNSPGRNGEAQPISLSFVDAPGLYYEDLDGEKLIQEGMTIVDFLSRCHGIIFLLDPERARQDDQHKYRMLLDTLMQKLQHRAIKNGSGPRHEHYMAFCVTKVDEEQCWADRERPDMLVERVLSKRMFTLLGSQYCQQDRFMCFALSSIGRRRDPDNPENLLLNVEAVKPPQLPAPQEPARPQHAAQVRAVPLPLEVGAAPPLASVAPAPGGMDAVFGRQSGAPSAPPAQGSAKHILYAGDSINPLGVIEPLHWLIDQIVKQPPKIGPS